MGCRRFSSRNDYILNSKIDSLLYYLRYHLFMVRRIKRLYFEQAMLKLIIFQKGMTIIVNNIHKFDNCIVP